MKDVLHKQERPYSRRQRLLRTLAHALGGLLIVLITLTALAWALVGHVSREETVRRSNGKTATVQVHWFHWRAWHVPGTSAFIGDYPLGTLVRITDEHGSFRSWWPDSRATPIMALDLDGGYVVAFQYPFFYKKSSACWLGPQGQQTTGFPRHLPLRRCVQNLGLSPRDRVQLRNFDPADGNSLLSDTAYIWICVLAEAGKKAGLKELEQVFETEFGGERDLLKAASSRPESRDQ